MTFKTKKTWKDYIENRPDHVGLTRRDFLARGLATGAMAVTFPELAFAASSSSTCTVNRALGAVGHLFAAGGPTMGARFIGEAQAAAMNSTMAANYGISGTNLVKLGPNLVIDSTSPFGFTLLQGPPGFAGGPAGWRTNVLNKLSGGGHLGPFNKDDGAGIDTGLVGAVSPFKTSQMGKDLRIGVVSQVATWAKGLPSASALTNNNLGDRTFLTTNLSSSSLAQVFSLTPPAKGLTNSTALNRTSDAANALAQAMSSLFGTNTRKGGSQTLASASCAFYGNTAYADPNYGASLFNPNNIANLKSSLTVGNLTNEEQALLAAFYQSASGMAGGVMVEMPARDYHGQDPQTVIAPADIEEARTIVMFLAACNAAQAPGAFIYTANGQAIANGTAQVTATINGTNATLNAPVAAGDAGGAYNAGLIIFYDPKGSPPATKLTGMLSTSGDGSVTAASSISSSEKAIAGLYLSALNWINGGNLPQAALAAMQATGAVSGRPAEVEVI
jgi:hypothetical protein